MSEMPLGRMLGCDCQAHFEPARGWVCRRDECRSDCPLCPYGDLSAARAGEQGNG